METMKNEKVTLYYCITYYQVFISIIKQLQNCGEADIILSDAIPDYESINRRLNGRIFRKIILFTEKDFVKQARDKFHTERKKMGRINKLFTSKLRWIKIQNLIITYAKNNFTLDLNEYGDIFVFGQGRSFAPFLFAMKKKYILMEDSIDYFRKGINTYVDRNRMDHPRRFYLINRLLDLIGIYYYMGGYSHAEKAIEVNSNDNLVFSRCAKKKVTIVPRNILIQNLSDIQKKLVYDIFIGTQALSVDRRKKTALILTSPFLYDGLVQSAKDLVFVYRQLIDQVCPDALVFIKPHPRDFVNYLEYQNELGTFILVDKNIPCEVFSFNSDIYFDLVVTISSTAIQQADYAHKKINLGMEWFESELKKVIEMRKSDGRKISAL